MRRCVLTLIVIPLAGACGGNGDGAATADNVRAQADSASRDSSAIRAPDWPAPGADTIAVELARSFDFTGDGDPERIRVEAAGVAYDSLQIALTITGPAGDTLWTDGWPSLHYFKYEPLEGKSDTTIARTVRNHVAALVHDDKFGEAGLPAALRRGGDAGAVSEAVRYHLAELDWRAAAGLRPRDATPPDAHSSIRADAVAPLRVESVVNELLARPSFMYYAGGEATYAIGWSEREQAFVRLYSCC